MHNKAANLSIIPVTMFYAHWLATHLPFWRLCHDFTASISRNDAAVIIAHICDNRPQSYNRIRYRLAHPARRYDFYRLKYFTPDYVAPNALAKTRDTDTFARAPQPRHLPVTVPDLQRVASFHGCTV
jgi:hypothetical protein